MTLEEDLDEIVAEWLKLTQDSLIDTASMSYSAGMYHAVSQLNTGISFKVVESDALKYAEEYGKRLIETGKIDVTEYIKNEAGDVIGFETKMFPTHVGMNRLHTIYRAIRSYVPYTRGDEPFDKCNTFGGA